MEDDRFEVFVLVPGRQQADDRTHEAQVFVAALLDQHRQEAEQDLPLLLPERPEELAGLGRVGVVHVHGVTAAELREEVAPVLVGRESAALDDHRFEVL